MTGRRPEVTLSVTINDGEVFRVSSNRHTLIPANAEIDIVLRALVNGLATLLGTDISNDAPNSTIDFLHTKSAP